MSEPQIDNFNKNLDERNNIDFKFKEVEPEYPI